MKKFIKSLFAVMICVISLFAFTACGKTNMSETTNVTEGVISNGGMTLTYNGYVYFINGKKENNQTNNEGTIVQGGVYRVKIDDEGKLVDGSAEKLVNRLVGFDNGSIFIFGDYLYYTTPCRDKNKEGTMLFNKTEFRRYDLKSKKDQHLYTTNASESEITFGYYKDGSNLDLVVFEKVKSGSTAKNTLTSLRIGKKVETLFVKEDVQSVVLSENYGVNTVDGQFADSYVYYTLSADQDSEYTRGVRVYKVKPNGEKEQKISEGESVTLLTIRASRLFYAYDSKIYVSNINNDKQTLSFDVNSIVCYSNYENIIFLEDATNSVLIVDNGVLRTISWTNGVLNSKEIYTFDSSDSISFIGVEGDYVYYRNSNTVWKLNFKATEEEKRVPVKLSTTSINDASGNLVPELNNGYVYGLYTDSKNSLTYLYRINVLTPKEREEKDDKGAYKSVGEAEFIGIKE